MLELTVKTLDSQNHSFTVPDETTVRQLKENIFEKMEVPIEIQRLIFHGKVLQDEKKLTDYGDVNGKVIHLVQRPPPTAARGSNNSGSDSNLRSNIRRSPFGHRDRLDGSNTTYLGAMAFPTDFVEAQGMMQSLPSQSMSRTRLSVARRILNRAGGSLLSLQLDGRNFNVGQGTANNSENMNLPRSSVNSSSTDEGREDAEILLGAASSSIAQAAQAATAAAIAAAVSAAQATTVPHITIRGPSGQANSVPGVGVPTDTHNRTLDDVNLFLDENHPEDVAAEVEIGGNNDSGQDRQEGGSTGNNRESNGSAPGNGNAQRPTTERSLFVSLLNQLHECQRNFEPWLRLCQQLLLEDPSFSENSSPNAEDCQRIFNGVSEIMHLFAHVYHALSDIMVDFNEDAPRALRCHPFIIQHTAILESGFPVQAQINLSPRRPQSGSHSNASSADSTRPASMGNSTLPTHTETAEAPPRSSTSTANTNTATEQSQETGDNGNVTSQASASSFASSASQQSEDRSTSSQGGNGNNAFGFFLSGPGNVEIFMDLGPQGVTLGSLEATVIRGSETRNSTNNLGSGIQLGTIGTGRPPVELIQSVQAVAGQLQHHLLGRVNQASQADQPPPYEANSQQGVSLSYILSNHSVSPQAWNTSSAESNNASTTIPALRHQIHMGHMNPGIAFSSYDPFLPCHSHHVRSTQRIQNSQGSSRNATAAGNPMSNTNANPTTSDNVNPNANASASENERSTNGHEGTSPVLNLLGELYMAFLAHVVNPLRHNILGRRIPAQGQNASGSRGNLQESPRVNIREGGGSDRNPIGQSSTLFDFLFGISGTSYVEGESIITDFLVTLSRNMTWLDIIELSSMVWGVVESLVTRLQPVLQNFVLQCLLQGEPPSPENMVHGCERLYADMRPYLELMQQFRLRESVDFTATINNFNQTQLPEIISLIIDSSQSQSDTFGQNITRRIRNYMDQLIALIIHCCQDGSYGFHRIIQTILRLLVRDVPEELQQWAEVHTLRYVQCYTVNLEVPLEEIQRYIVYKNPSSSAQRNTPSAPVHEPMETDSPSTDFVWVSPGSLPSAEREDDSINNINDGLVGVDNENLPDVLIGSETWHNALPSEWVPIIARDTQRQRRQSTQKPFSDAYLSSLPAKRRKLIASSKPQGNLSQVISDGVRQAISAAGVSSPVVEKVIAEAGKDDVLQAAYKEQERVCVSADLKRNPDFSPSRFPNAFKYFDK